MSKPAISGPEPAFVQIFHPSDSDARHRLTTDGRLDQAAWLRVYKHVGYLAPYAVYRPDWPGAPATSTLRWKLRKASAGRAGRRSSACRRRLRRRTICGMAGADQRPPSGAPGGLVVNLLWTGGWDSTFRLLSLITSSPCRVQPYYIVDRARPSWQKELATMAGVAAACSQQFGQCGARILKSIIVDIENIREDAEITQKFLRLSSRCHLGGQYDWLARFAKQNNIDDAEIGVHGEGNIYCLLKGHVELETHPLRRFGVRADAGGDLTMFRFFRFPLLELSKREMEAIAKEKGFLDILNLAWTCFRPIRNRWPCGMCNPCRIAIAEGMARRVGWRGVACRYTLGFVAARMPQGAKRAVQRQWPHMLGRS